MTDVPSVSLGSIYPHSRAGKGPGSGYVDSQHDLDVDIKLLLNRVTERAAAESAVFRTAFLSAGLTGDFGGTWSLTRLVGAGRARHLFFLNEKLSAASAAAMGLVGEVVADSALMDRVAGIASGLAQAPPQVIAGIKQNLNDAQELGLHAMLNTEADRQVGAALSHPLAPRT